MKKEIKKKKTKKEPLIRAGILGYGEVGQAIAKFYKKGEVFIKDIDQDNFPDKLEVLHVCIPGNLPNFSDIVIETIEHHMPDMVINHASTKPNTTLRIWRKYPIIVHSPIRGVHPNLYEGIKTFVKFVGADEWSFGKAVVNYLNQIGMKAELIGDSSVTETFKLLDTTQYGADIAYYDWVNEVCEKAGINFQAYIRYNETYNEGYTKLGMENVVRPLLYPANGKIGGHCVIPNAEILKEEYGTNGFIEEILKRK